MYAYTTSLYLISKMRVGVSGWVAGFGFWWWCVSFYNFLGDSTFAWVFVCSWWCLHL